METLPKAKLISFCSILIFILTACGASEEVVVQYQYDALGRLNQVDDTVNGNRAYQYDPAGNRTLLSVVSASSSTSSGGTKPTPTAPPAPSNARKSGGGNFYSMSWDVVPEADYYEWADNRGNVTKTTSTTAGLGSFNGEPRPYWVRSCKNPSLCSLDVYFD